MYKDAIKEHAYQSAMSNLEDDYVPFDEFLAEQQKVEVCRVQFLLLVQTEEQSLPTGHRRNYTDPAVLAVASGNKRTLESACLGPLGP